MSPRRKKKQPVLPLVMIAAGGLLIIAVLAYIGGQQGSGPNPTVFPTAAMNNRIPYPEVERVSLADAHAAWEAGTAVFADTRGEPFYSAHHIPGAINLPDQAVPGGVADLPRDAWIITYCT